MAAPRGSIAFIAAGSLGFGVLGLARPHRLAALIGSDEETARTLGVRDLTNGLALAAALATGRDPRPALAARALADLSDAWKFGRSDRRVLAGALASAALAGIVYVRAGRAA
jgi:hypothetical protein